MLGVSTTVSVTLLTVWSCPPVWPRRRCLPATACATHASKSSRLPLWPPRTASVITPSRYEYGTVTDLHVYAQECGDRSCVHACV